jgi:hypothetical protein
MNDRPSPSNSFLNAEKKHPIYRVFIFTIVPLSISLLLGFSFFLIAHGLIFGFLWLSPYWPPAFAFSKRYLLFPHGNVEAKSIPVTWWRIPTILLKGGLSLAMICAGFLVLFTRGFLAQNILWLLFR